MYPRSLSKPATLKFIIFSLVFAFLLRILPWSLKSPYYLYLAPDILMMTLSFWALREPQKVSIGLAFICGLCLDVHTGVKLGQYAMIYSLVVFAANLLHRRSAYFGLMMQAMYFLPIFFLARLMIYGFSYHKNIDVPIYYWLTPILEFALWPVLGFLLLMPQNMSNQKDYTRPI